MMLKTNQVSGYKPLEISGAGEFKSVIFTGGWGFLKF